MGKEEKEILIYCFTLQTAVAVTKKTRPIWSQELHPGHLCGWQGLKNLDNLWLLSQAHFQGARFRVEQPGHRLGHIWESSITALHTGTVLALVSFFALKNTFFTFQSRSFVIF